MDYILQTKLIDLFGKQPVRGKTDFNLLRALNYLGCDVSYHYNYDLEKKTKFKICVA